MQDSVLVLYMLPALAKAGRSCRW